MNCNEKEKEEVVLPDHDYEISHDQVEKTAASSIQLLSGATKGEKGIAIETHPAELLSANDIQHVDHPKRENPSEDSKEDDDVSSSSPAEPTESCPICLNPTEELVSGPCNHSTCRECMELLLNANAEVERWPPPAAADAHLSAPTLGRCPICRSMVSLFDIVDSKTRKPLYPPDVDSWRNEEKREESDRQLQHTVKEIITNPVASLSYSFASSATISASVKNPLENAVYMPYRGMPGEMSFHWDWKKVKTDDEELVVLKLPFLNLERAIEKRPDFWRLEDQSSAKPIQFMQEGCHFHKPSRTFHGTVRWPILFKGSYEWDIILGFSKDYRFISSGRIHHKRGRKLEEGSVPATFAEKERELCKHPMDGRWTVVWENGNGEERRHEIHVVNNEFRQSGWPFYFNFQDPANSFVQWPRSRDRQTIVEGIDLLKEPLGPKVGGKVRWETSDPNAPNLVWIRQTIGPNPIEIVHNYGMGQGKFLYQRFDADLGSSIPKHNGDSVFGNVFTKRMFLGSASYHFVSPTQSYMSYKHPACRDLPTMDDGSPLPTRVDFRNLKWDPEQRKLTAAIEWEKDFGTSWNDNIRWKLTMYFDSEYMVILKGGIQCEWCQERRARSQPPRPQPRNRPAPVPIYVPPAPEEEQETPAPQPDRNEEWVMSGYGHDLLYLNAACLERYRPRDRLHRRNNENGEEENEEPVKIDYRGLFLQHAKRLEHEGATKRTIGFLSHLFELADNDDENPIDFLV